MEPLPEKRFITSSALTLPRGACIEGPDMLPMLKCGVFMPGMEMSPLELIEGPWREGMLTEGAWKEGPLTRGMGGV
jgi:hypothetical protein